MTKDEEKPTTETKEIGLVSLTGEVGIGIRMPDESIVELNNVDAGTAEILAYLVKNVSEIRKNI
jgi:hypothetical protein